MHFHMHFQGPKDAFQGPEAVPETELIRLCQILPRYLTNVLTPKTLNWVAHGTHTQTHTDTHTHTHSGSGLRVKGTGFRVLGFRVYGSGLVFGA